MLRNYFTIAWRNLVKNRISSIINIGGLTIGIAVAMLIGLWLYDELSFNKYHSNYERIARVMIRGNDTNHGPYISNSVQYPLATALQKDYSNQFTHVVRSSWAVSNILTAGEKKISQTGQFMDAGAPAMLTLKMLQGNWSALQDPYSIILSQSVAGALFSGGDAINKTLLLNNKIPVKVTGVYEDLPQNTQFQDIKFISPWDLWEKDNEWIAKRAITDWNNHFIRLYAAIKPGSDFVTVSNTIKDAEMKKIKGLGAYAEEAATNPQVMLHPMSQWHLYPYKKGITDEKPVSMLWMVGIIGLFVLLLACINFMNLSTARSEKRAKEVGIRKTIGSMRKQLVYQFFIESFVVVIFSFMLACLLVVTTLPWFNILAGKETKMPWHDIYFWMLSAGFVVLTAVLAGSYPAFYLSSFKPVKVLKGSFRVGKLAAIPRKALVVMQFTVSVALIISTIVVYRQLQYAKDRPVGYNREGLITIEMKSDDYKGKYDLLRTEFLNTGVVTAFSESMGKVTEVVSGNDGFEWRNKPVAKDKSFATLAVTHEHGSTAGWQFVAGRDFSRKMASDSSGVVLNEAAVRYMGLQHPVDEVITWKWRNNAPKPYTVLGVVKDMVMASPYEPVEPTMFFVKALNGGVNTVNMRINPAVAMGKAIPVIEAAFKKLLPAVPFEYKFVDEEYALKFAAEERISQLAGFFAALAIFISCLGLFGLASFVAEQRTKEIGVRKILGATLFDVWRLLSKEFAWLIIISLFIAAPLAWYFMSNWLQGYQYRTQISWWIFAAAGAGALLITLLTVSFQAIKTGLMNPVVSLRSE